MFCRYCSKQVVIRSCLAVLLLVMGPLLVGCSGSGSSSNNTGGSGSGPSPTITSVSVSCGAGTVPVNQTDQCTATVQGSGNFDSSVNWSVSGAAAGNSTVGTVNATGLYTAPTSVPTPFTVTLTATSIANSTVSGSVSLIIAGTIASITQTVSAASGGAITLPDGSSITIAAGVLPADETMTLSEVSVVPNEPPNPALTNTGAGLILSFANPVRFAAAIPIGRRTGVSAVPASQGTGSAAIQFSLSVGGYDQNLLQNVESSVPFADFTDSSGSNNFMGLSGGFVSASETFLGNAESQLVAGLRADTSAIQSIVFGAAKLATSVVRLLQTPTRLSFDFASSSWQTNPNWTSADCPSGTTLVLVHGMASSVEDSFDGSVVGEIEKGSSNYYNSVVGFDYNWLQPINQSGAQLASFLNDLSTDCENIASLDIEAHSEGVPVSMSALTQSSANITHLISIAGPIMGTPLASDGSALKTVVLNLAGLDLPSGTSSVLDIFTAPFLSDLIPGSGTLSTIRSGLATRFADNAPQLIITGGDNPITRPSTGTTVWLGFLSPVMGSNFDGVVPWTSALSFGSGLNAYPLVDPIQLFIGLGHNDLVANFNVQTLIGDQVKKGLGVSGPSLSCTGSAPNCEGTQGTTFTFDGQGFSPEPTAVQIFQQNSSGDVIQVPAALQDSGGNVTWSITPTCSDATGSFSIMLFDTGESLASNDLMQTIDAGTCSGTNPNPVPSISSLSPASLPLGSAPQTLTVVGTGFLSNSSVTFNGVSHTPSIISSTGLSISLSSSDLATLGSYPVVVTNPAPGGGTSNAVDFTVSSAVSGSVTISPPAVTVPEGGAQTFTASVVGGGDGVTWTIQEGATGGTILDATSTSVTYVPPSSTGTFHVVATNADNSSQSAAATVSVVPAISLTVLHTFDPSQGDGTDPVGELLQASDGNLYGMTYSGGSSDSGTIFKIDSSGNFATVVSFAASGPGGPDSGLIEGSDGNFYGTSFYGGTGGRGTVFRADGAGNVTVLHSFTDTDAGANPYAGVIQAANGSFYGTTWYGNELTNGTAFKIDSSGNVTFLHSFSYSEGTSFYAPLTQAGDGSFYGTAYSGGAAGGTGAGSVYKMDSSGTVTVIHSFSFSSADGVAPFAGLVQGTDGYLYGTTVSGGAYGYGTVFKVDTAGNLTVLHSFSGGQDGAGPYGRLLQGTDGNFYGTTSVGGASGYGTIFRIDPAGDLTVLQSFPANTRVITGVTLGTDGNLYGTGQGGSNSSGIIYRLDLAAFPTGAARTKRASRMK